MDLHQIVSDSAPVVGGFFYNQTQKENWPVIAIFGYSFSAISGALWAWFFIRFLAWWSSEEMGDF